MMRHWLSLRGHDPAELAALVDKARRIKRGDRSAAGSIAGKLLVMLFFNSSLRTRASFEAAMARFGGAAIVLNVGGDTWKLEYRDNVVMNGEAAEHVREAAPVLGRYGDALAVRTFAALRDADEDMADRVIGAFAEFGGKPVVNMESASEHPCQGLADWMTMAEKLGPLRGRRFTLTWAPHIKPLPMAVPHSALLAAAAAGMQVTIVHPPGYELHREALDVARRWCAAHGQSLTVSDDQFAATRQADIVYAKSWGAAGWYGDAARQSASFSEHAAWCVRPEHLGSATLLMHCLPVRRDVVVSAAALDDSRCIVVDQAENRLWAQAAILDEVFGGQQS